MSFPSKSFLILFRVRPEPTRVKHLSVAPISCRPLAKNYGHKKFYDIGSCSASQCVKVSTVLESVASVFLTEDLLSYLLLMNLYLLQSRNPFIRERISTLDLLVLIVYNSSVSNWNYIISFLIKPILIRRSTALSLPFQ